MPTAPLDSKEQMRMIAAAKSTRKALEAPELNEHYIVHKTIGVGSFGVVKSAIHRLTNQNVAIKIIDKEKVTESNNCIALQREIDILKRVRHPGVINVHHILEVLILERIHFDN